MQSPAAQSRPQVEWQSPAAVNVFRTLALKGACGFEDSGALARAERRSKLVLLLGLLLVAMPLALYPVSLWTGVALGAIGLALLAWRWLFHPDYSKTRPITHAITTGRLRSAWMLKVAGSSSVEVRGAALVVVCDDPGPEPEDSVFVRAVEAVHAASSEGDESERQMASIREDLSFVPWRRRRLPRSAAPGNGLLVCDAAIVDDWQAGIRDIPWVPCFFDDAETGGIWIPPARVLVEICAELERRGMRPPSMSSEAAAARRSSRQSGSPGADRAGLQHASTGPRASSIPSITMLRSKSAGLKLDHVQGVVSRVLGAQAAAREVARNASICTFRIVSPRGYFVIHDSTVPYVPRDQLAAWAAGIQNVQASRLAAMHAAFVAVDCMQTSEEPREMYQALGAMAAELMDDHCLLLYSTELATCAVPDEKAPEVLRTDPITLFPGHNVNYFRNDDPGMVAGIAEARRRWPEFVEEYRAHGHEGLFTVKVKFEHAAGGEHMWIKVQSIEGGKITGELGSKPVHIATLSEGDRVTVNEEQISDWSYAYKGKAEGFFTDARMRAFFANME